METSFQSALAEAREAMQRRDAARAAAILRELAGSVPPPGFPWLELATAELVLGRGDAAEAAIDRQLEAAIRDVAALLMKGRLREQAGDARAASSFYRAAEAQITFDGHCPPDMVPLRAHAQAYLASSEQDFTAHLLGSLDGTLSPTMREAVELLTGQRQLYLQEPKVFYYPGLPQRRFWEVDEFPWLHDMLAFVPQMQAELAAVIEGGDTGFDPYVRHDPSRPAPANHLLGKADWSAFHFWRDGAVVAELSAEGALTGIRYFGDGAWREDWPGGALPEAIRIDYLDRGRVVPPLTVIPARRARQSEMSLSSPVPPG